MKFKILTLTFLLMSGNICAASAQQRSQQEEALQSFQSVVGRFNFFFKEKTKFVDEHLFSKSPSGITFSVFECEATGVAYDIQETDSILSPFVGYIDVTMTFRSNASCGTIKTQYGTYGWDNIKDALKARNIESCYGWAGKASGKSAPFENRFIFAYQNGKWIFKNVISKGSKEKQRQLSALLGTQIGSHLVIVDPEGRLYNQPWMDLIGVGK